MAATEAAKEIEIEETDELEADMTSIMGTVALVCTLVIAFAYAPGADTVDLGGDCEDVNIYSTCDASDTAIKIYKLLCYTCCMSATIGTLSSVAIIFMLAKMRRKFIPDFIKSLGPLIKVPSFFMTVAIVAFILMMIMQASLTLETGYFAVVAAMFTLWLVAYAVFGALVKRKGDAFLSPLWK